MMGDLMERLELAIKTIVAVLAVFWGSLIPLVQLLLILMFIDIVSGFVIAIQERELSSDVAWKGMTKKAMALLLVVTAGVVEVYGTNLVGGLPLQAAVAGFYAAGEILSVIENAAAAGLPIPDVLRQVLAKLSPEKADIGNG